VPRPALELADIFREHGPGYRQSHGLPLDQLRVMRAIEICRTAALGGHIEQCSHCPYTYHAYNSCRNRHCPKCQSVARAKWVESRKLELLPVEYFHVVFTLPEPIAQVALQNKTVVYNILFRASAETLLTIAGDPQHLGAGIGFFSVLHTWGQNLLHHPHLHCVVPGGGLSPDQQSWIACRPGFFLPVRVLSRLFRRLFLEQLQKAFDQGQLQFFGDLEPLQEVQAFTRHLAPLKEAEWVVYAKPPFGGPQQVLEYLGRYTHRVVISNQRLLAVENGQVSFQWKDYRTQDQSNNSKVMTLKVDEFIRRFLLHALPPGLRRIRYGGLLANCRRKDNLARCRQLLAPLADLLPQPAQCPSLCETLAAESLRHCPKCGIGTMIRVLILPAYRWPTIPPPDSS
jgi:Putative transposase/Transposase zinc-binding domain